MKKLMWIGLLLFELLLVMAMVGPVCVYRGDTMHALYAYSKDRSPENHRKLQAECRIDALQELALRAIVGAVLVCNTIALYRSTKRMRKASDSSSEGSNESNYRGPHT